MNGDAGLPRLVTGRTAVLPTVRYLEIVDNI